MVFLLSSIRLVLSPLFNLRISSPSLVEEIFNALIALNLRIYYIILLYFWQYFIRSIGVIYSQHRYNELLWKIEFST